VDPWLRCATESWGDDIAGKFCNCLEDLSLVLRCSEAWVVEDCYPNRVSSLCECQIVQCGVFGRFRPDQSVCVSVVHELAVWGRRLGRVSRRGSPAYLQNE